MQPPIRKTTFIVRLWTDGDPTDESSWRGVAERVGTERECKFQKLDVLLNWIRREIVIVQEQNNPPTDQFQGAKNEDLALS